MKRSTYNQPNKEMIRGTNRPQLYHYHRSDNTTASSSPSPALSTSASNSRCHHQLNKINQVDDANNNCDIISNKDKNTSTINVTNIIENEQSYPNTTFAIIQHLHYAGTVPMDNGPGNVFAVTKEEHNNASSSTTSSFHTRINRRFDEQQHQQSNNDFKNNENNLDGTTIVSNLIVKSDIPISPKTSLLSSSSELRTNQRFTNNDPLVSFKDQVIQRHRSTRPPPIPLTATQNKDASLDNAISTTRRTETPTLSELPSSLQYYDDEVSSLESPILNTTIEINQNYNNINNNVNGNKNNGTSLYYVEAVPVQPMILVTAQILAQGNNSSNGEGNVNLEEGTIPNYPGILGAASNNNCTPNDTSTNHDDNSAIKILKQNRCIFVTIGAIVSIGIVAAIILASIYVSKTSRQQQDNTNSTMSESLVGNENENIKRQPAEDSIPTISPTTMPLSGSSGQPTIVLSPFTSSFELISIVDSYLDGTEFDKNYGSIEHWDVSNITVFASLFSVSRNTKVSRFNADLSRWDMSNAVNVSEMFYGAIEFASSLSEWNVSKVKYFDGMFSGASKFSSNISKWDVSSAVTMDYMFQDTESFTSDLSDWDVSSVTSTYEMFLDAKKFESDLSKWDISKLEHCGNMFNGATNFRSDLSKWNTSKVYFMHGFAQGTKYFDTNFSLWDTSRVVNIQCMFMGAEAITGTGIENWDVGNVEMMDYAFCNTKLFDANLSRWDTSNVVTTDHMFAETDSFRGTGLEYWNVSSVMYSSYMFHQAKVFDKNLSSWDVTKIDDLSEMFSQTTQFQGKGLENWGTNATGKFEAMFCNATAFNQSYISSWNVSWIELTC